MAERSVRTWSFGELCLAHFISNLRSAVRNSQRGRDRRGKTDWEGGRLGEALMMF